MYLKFVCYLSNMIFLSLYKLDCPGSHFSIIAFLLTCLSSLQAVPAGSQFCIYFLPIDLLNLCISGWPRGLTVWHHRMSVCGVTSELPSDQAPLVGSAEASPFTPCPLYNWPAALRRQLCPLVWLLPRLSAVLCPPAIHRLQQVRPDL